jgi:SAM-dependent methyltransferase
MSFPRLKAIIKKLFWVSERKTPVNRSIALQEEVQFWRDWFKTKGLQWPEDFRSRFNPEQPIQDRVGKFIDRLDAERIQILDVGAGPMTKLGKKHPSKQLEITATDLLASEYDGLLAELKIEPPLRTIYANGERLVEQFGQNAFDIVYAENCVDHMVDPLRAIDQMLMVTKPKGYVVLYHKENEGVRQRYRQLHQWNITCENESFVIMDHRGRKTNVTKRLAARCKLECIRHGDNNILIGILKQVV